MRVADSTLSALRLTDLDSTIDRDGPCDFSPDRSETLDICQCQGYMLAYTIRFLDLST